MPRTKRIQQSEVPYSITSRCINRDWFGMPLEEVWEVMSEELFGLARLFEFRIHLFVLMDNHYHMVASTPQANISEGMATFNRRTSVRITKSQGRINQTYGARHYPCLLNSTHYYLNTYKYFYRNPVEAGLVRNVEDYRFGTLSGLLGTRHLFIPVWEDETLFSDVEGTLKWLNTCPRPEDRESMRKALGRRTFLLCRHPTTKRRNDLEESLL